VRQTSRAGLIDGFAFVGVDLSGLGQRNQVHLPMPWGQFF
jgi:hypothetical protein